VPGHTAVQQTRRDEGPLTDRGSQRKRALIEAARRVFEGKGFIDATVRDITVEADVSHVFRYERGNLQGGLRRGGR